MNLERLGNCWKKFSLIFRVSNPQTQFFLQRSSTLSVNHMPSHVLQQLLKVSTPPWSVFPRQAVATGSECPISSRYRASPPELPEEAFKLVITMFRGFQTHAGIILDCLYITLLQLAVVCPKGTFSPINSQGSDAVSF